MQARGGEPAFKAPRYIVIEGPLRVGKSTLARFLADRMHARRVVDARTILSWPIFTRKTRLGVPRPDVFFETSGISACSEARQGNVARPLVGDFLFEKDKIFAYLNLDNEELELYERYFEAIAPAVRKPPDLVIYLQATPEVLRERIAKKGARRRIAHFGRLH